MSRYGKRIMLLTTCAKEPAEYHPRRHHREHGRSWWLPCGRVNGPVCHRGIHGPQWYIISTCLNPEDSLSWHAPGQWLI